MLLKLILCFSLVISSYNISFANDYFSDVYDEVDDFLELTTRYDEAKKEDSWLPKFMTETKKEVNEDINEFLEDVLLMLSNEDILEFKENITDLAKENYDLAEKMAELSMKKQSAEKDKKFYEVWKTSKNDIDQKLKNMRAEIADNKLKIEQNRQKIVAFLRNSGVNISQTDADSLLKTVTGNDFVDTIAILKNVHNIISGLQQTMQEENENINIARKYYGLFWLSTRAYYRQLEIFMERIDTNYLVKLESIEEDNNKLMQETRSLAISNKSYQSNLQAQQLTDKAINTYRMVLEKQKIRIREQMEKVAQILKHAENTFKTVNIAHSLYQSMDENLNSYNALMSLPMLEVAPFENTALELKMIELTEQIIND